VKIETDTLPSVGLKSETKLYAREKRLISADVHLYYSLSGQAKPPWGHAGIYSRLAAFHGVLIQADCLADSAPDKTHCD
jgi:hypothetical protein